MTFRRGEIVLAPFKFMDMDVYRLRPVLVVSHQQPYAATGGFVGSMITAARQSIWPFDVSIGRWSEAGLTVPSSVRLKLFTIAVSEVRQSIGQLDEPTLEQVGDNLIALLT